MGDDGRTARMLRQVEIEDDSTSSECIITPSSSVKNRDLSFQLRLHIRIRYMGAWYSYSLLVLVGNLTVRYRTLLLAAYRNAFDIISLPLTLQEFVDYPLRGFLSLPGIGR